MSITERSEGWLMSSGLGEKLRINIFGQSHGAGIGVLVEGLPGGEDVDMAQLQAFLSRRAPGKSKYTTARREADAPRFLSGILNGKTCCAPLCAVIENTDTRSSDYEKLKQVPRPGHADYTAWVKYGGTCDMRGGGHFSGRLTAGLCIVGGICMQILARRGIYIGAHIARIGSVQDELYDSVSLTKQQLLSPGEKEFPVINDVAGEQMKKEIELAAVECDSVGGSVECCILGLPAGLGDPMFDGLENRLSAALFGIPAVKGVQFGAGFDFAGMRGSRANDPFVLHEGRVETTKNDSGGILGGISTGMPIVMQAAFKPTPSIAQRQQSVDLVKMQPAELEITGRHDPCIVQRAVPCVEAAAAIVALDLLLQGK